MLIRTCRPLTVLGSGLMAAVIGLAPTSPAEAMVIVNDSWPTGDRSDEAGDPLDAAWWTTSNSNAIEVSVGSLGLVTGSSGRGIRATFAPQTLAVGETIIATYTFTTPDTVGTNRSGAFRVAMFDKLGRAGLEADLSASSGSPEPLYDGLPGYYADYDVATGSENIGLRKQDTSAATGRLLGTSSGFDSLGSGGDPYSITANTTYIGTFAVTRTGADTADVTSSLLDAAGNLLSTHTESDASDIANNFGMLAFHANSNTFGLLNSPDLPDNGIDFSNVTIEIIPEPSSLALAAFGGLALLRRRA